MQRYFIGLSMDRYPICPIQAVLFEFSKIFNPIHLSRLIASAPVRDCHNKMYRFIASFNSDMPPDDMHDWLHYLETHAACRPTASERVGNDGSLSLDVMLTLPVGTRELRYPPSAFRADFGSVLLELLDYLHIWHGQSVAASLPVGIPLNVLGQTVGGDPTTFQLPIPVTRARELQYA